MNVRVLMDMLEECDPEAEVYVGGKPLGYVAQRTSWLTGAKVTRVELTGAIPGTRPPEGAVGR